MRRVSQVRLDLEVLQELQVPRVLRAARALPVPRVLEEQLALMA